MQNLKNTAATSVSDVERSANDFGHSKLTSLPRENEAIPSETEQLVGNNHSGVTTRYDGPKEGLGHSRETVTSKHYGIANS